jgi:hypothetical protein
MRRAQSLSIYENTQIDMQPRLSVNRPRPATPSRTLNITTNTIVHLDPSENWKNGN